MIKHCKNCNRYENNTICMSCFIYDKWKRQEKESKERIEKTKGIGLNGKT